MMNSSKPYSLHTRNNAHLTITHTMKNCTPTHTTPTHPVNRTHASERVHSLYTELAYSQNLSQKFVENIIYKTIKREKKGFQKYCVNIIKGKGILIQKFIRRFLKNIANKQKRKELLYNVKRGDIFRKNNSKKIKRLMYC